MKYMMLIYFHEGVLTEEAQEICYVESKELAHELAARGQFIDASPLHSINSATSIRIREGKRMITDGPFAETHEQLGGYYVIEAPNLDDAIEIAARIPAAKYGTVEVRPLIQLDGVPERVSR